MRKLRKTLVLGVVLFASIAGSFVSAQKEMGIFNTVAVGLSASTTGVGVDVAAPITPFFAVRGGVDFMPNFNFKADVDVEIVGDEAKDYPATINMKGGLKRTSGNLLVNYYPFRKGGFFVTAGAYFGGSTMMKLKGHSKELEDYIDQHGGQADVIIGSYAIPVDKDGNVSGGINVFGCRPYVGLGFGRAVPEKRLGFMFELGVQFHGSPKIYTDYGDLETALEATDDNFTKIVDKVIVYPVLKFRLCGRIL